MFKSKVLVGGHCEPLSKEYWGHASEQKKVKRLERISPEICRVLRLVSKHFSCVDQGWSALEAAAPHGEYEMKVLDQLLVGLGVVWSVIPKWAVNPVR